MQSTTCLHDGIANAILQEAYPVFHNPVVFAPTDRVFHTNFEGCHSTISRFLLGCEFTSTVTGLIDHEEIFDRVAHLLATIVFLLVLGILWALDRSLRTIMPKKGGRLFL